MANGIYSYSDSRIFVPIVTTGVYDITAYGVLGGGKGAEISGQFALSARTVLEIVGGGQGKYGTASGDGGSGSFVWANFGSTTDTRLLIAGGRGGVGVSPNPSGPALIQPGGPGQINTNGQTSIGGGAGGTTGNGECRLVPPRRSAAGAVST